MKKIILISSLFLLALFFIGPWRPALAGGQPPAWRTLPARSAPQKESDEVKNSLSALKPGQQTTVIVTLRQQADLSQTGGLTRGEHDREVVRSLQSTADSTQAGLKKLLGQRLGEHKVRQFEALWVINGFSITASPEVIAELSQDPDVYSITTDAVPVVPSALGAPQPNITNTNAPALWNLGYNGTGIVVASMDTGVDVTHPDLASRWRGGTNSWYDPYGQHPSTPTDKSGHGTWTMGVMVGGDAGGSAIGMAPGAKWISVKIFNDAGSATATAIHKGFQWLLDPDGNPATADAPQVVSNSWTYGAPGCSLEFEPDLEALRSAGILPVFAAGNGGPGAGTSYSPANNPAAFAVGAVDNNDLIASFSSRGPAACSGKSVYPDVVAPGVNILSSDLFGGYFNSTGTSLAAPHVAGGLALLLQAYPNLSAADQANALITSALDLGAAGPDNVFGYGRVDLLAAYSILQTAPSATPTSLQTYTPTAALIDTATATATATALPPVATATATDTALPPTVTATATDTALPPSATSTATATALPPTATATATSTALPPTATATATATALPPTATATSTATATALPPTATATATFTSTTTPTSTFTATATALPPTATATQTATATMTMVPPTATPVPTAFPKTDHIWSMAGSSAKSGSTWNASVTIVVHDGSEQPLAGARLAARWSDGAPGACITSSAGSCTITFSGLSSRTSRVSLLVTGISLFPYTYQPAANHYPYKNNSLLIINAPQFTTSSRRTLRAR